MYHVDDDTRLGDLDTWLSDRLLTLSTGMCAKGRSSLASWTVTLNRGAVGPIGARHWTGTAPTLAEAVSMAIGSYCTATDA